MSLCGRQRRATILASIERQIRGQASPSLLTRCVFSTAGVMSRQQLYIDLGWQKTLQQMWWQLKGTRWQAAAFTFITPVLYSSHWGSVQVLPTRPFALSSDEVGVGRWVLNRMDGLHFNSMVSSPLHDTLPLEACQSRWSSSSSPVSSSLAAFINLIAGCFSSLLFLQLHPQSCFLSCILNWTSHRSLSHPTLVLTWY